LHAEVTTAPEHSWAVKVRGWVEPHMISTHPIDEWISLKVGKTETYADFLMRLKNSKKPDLLSDEELGLKPEDVYFDAEVRGSGEHIRKFIIAYFKTV
jgi:hypothetical protein